ncbi:hypothetical protein L596_015323 [Steinernema carpocapsae]|uniref:Uncharacterized protein n=1 Tax=Steinernema carpocapsae TaxID=34508 RepID=A0A4U5NEN2_STECR|nr:hypothetical protein L596_015323 [Steinernema carpocapsae]
MTFPGLALPGNMAKMLQEASLLSPLFARGRHEPTKGGGSDPSWIRSEKADPIRHLCLLSPLPGTFGAKTI